METVYYIHNFKGRKGGTLFRFLMLIILELQRLAVILADKYFLFLGASQQNAGYILVAYSTSIQLSRNMNIFSVRCYPGPWKVLRKVRNEYICLHQQEVMPSLKEVALDILPSAWNFQYVILPKCSVLYILTKSDCVCDFLSEKPVCIADFSFQLQILVPKSIILSALNSNIT